MSTTRTALSLIVAVTVANVTGCAISMQSREPASSPDVLARRVEQAHGVNGWRSAQAIASDITIYFGDQKALEGSMTYAPHDNRSRIETADGTVMVFDGERAWVSPAEAVNPMVRFHVLTWPYFLAVPFKLRDPGSYRTAVPPAPLDGERNYRFKLTFGEGVGDAPKDWYVVYIDDQTDRLNGMAYIVTYGTTVAEAEKEPHAIAYHDYTRVGGMLLSTRWTFHGWSEDGGFDATQIGRAELSNLKVVPAEPAMFAAPPGAVEAPLPSP